MKIEKLKKQESVERSLASLYANYGYKRYRMGNFEEYSFYIKNKNFLSSDKIITFNDLDGRLMALKPDVTLSIVKNANAGDKFFYIENVYRPTKNSGYGEISQMGLETLGNIDVYTEAEVLDLAAKSLSDIDNNFVLDLSHMGLINILISKVEDKVGKRELLGYLRSKNYSEAKEKFGEEDLLKAFFECDLDFLSSYSKEAAEYVKELRFLRDGLEKKNVKVNIDFSLLNDEGYYNGIIFAGYVEKVPRPVLSGGRYDKLLARLKKDFAGLGFALYLNELDVYDVPDAYDCDVLIIYSTSNAAEAYKKADDMRKDNLSVRVTNEKTDNVKCRTLIDMGGAQC